MTHPHAEDHKMRRLLSIAVSVLIAAAILPGPALASGIVTTVSFAQVPGDAMEGIAFTPQPVVYVADDGGLAMPNVDVTLTIAGGTTGANLTCTSSNTATTGLDGNATFAGCSVDLAGTGYMLTATASNGGTPVSRESTPFNVTAPALAIAYPSLTAAGASHSLTVTAHTPAGAVDTGYAGTIHFTSSDAQATLPADYTFAAADAGSHAFSATLKTIGSQSITATDTVATTTITVKVTASGAVVASPDVVAVAPVVPSAIQVLANDSPSGSGPGQPVSITGVTQPKYGRVWVVGSSVVYDPMGCFVSDGTTDLFTYTMSDGLTSSTTAVVVTVVRPGQAVTAPAAVTLPPRPVSEVPSVALATGTLGSTVPVRVAWCGVVGTGVTSYSLLQSSDGGATFAAAYTGSTPATVRGLVPSRSYAWKAQTTDTSLRVGTSDSSPSLRALLVQDSATSSIRFAGSWSTTRGSSYSGGTERYNSRTSASATFTVVGARGFAIVSSKGVGRGSLKVYLDGVLVATVSERASSAQYKRIIYARGLAYGATTSHTIKLVPYGNGRVDLDAIVTLR